MSKAIVLDKPITRVVEYRIRHHDGLTWHAHPKAFGSWDHCVAWAEENYYVYHIIQVSFVLVAYSKGDDTKDARYHEQGDDTWKDKHSSI